MILRYYGNLDLNPGGVEDKNVKLIIGFTVGMFLLFVLSSIVVYFVFFSYQNKSSSESHKKHNPLMVHTPSSAYSNMGFMGRDATKEITSLGF